MDSFAVNILEFCNGSVTNKRKLGVRQLSIKLIITIQELVKIQFSKFLSFYQLVKNVVGCNSLRLLTFSLKSDTFFSHYDFFIDVSLKR